MAFIYTEGCQVPIDATHIIIDPSVKTICKMAFHKRQNIQSIEIPESVTTIDQRAFSHCSDLHTIKLPTDNWSHLTMVGKFAFEWCTSLRTVHLPDTIIYIGEGAFDGCTSLKTVRLPISITKIEDYTFEWCSSLDTIRIPYTVTSIGNSAFAMCKRLATIRLPDSLTTIGARAFQGCSSLGGGEATATGIGSVVRLPDSINTVSINAFTGCTALSTIEAPSSFPTTTIDNDSDSIREALQEAGFHPVKLMDILSHPADSGTRHSSSLYYDWKPSAKIKIQGGITATGRLPLCIGAERSVKWFSGLKNILMAYMPAVEETDPSTGFEPFMLAAVGDMSDIEAIYQLLREFPSAMRL